VHRVGDSGDAPLSSEALAMCSRALWHTLKTTTTVLGPKGSRWNRDKNARPDDPGGTFVHTGDIDDLWLRDSAAQVHPLLVPWAGAGGLGARGGALVSSDARLRRVVAGLIERSAFYIRHDPYANAFRIDTSYVFSGPQKALGRHDYISTWNYELDSGCYFLRMLYFFWRAAPEDPAPAKRAVHEAASILVSLWEAEQRHELDAFPRGPLFDCDNCGKPYRYKELPRGGKGAPTSPRAGLTWTGFRPSDDACKLHYLVPANMFAVVALGYAAEMADAVWHDPPLAARARALARSIDRGIATHGIVRHPKYGRMYAYEVDGLGNHVLMDDANVPSLLSAPYLGYAVDAEAYANTRRFILSPDNPTFARGTGGPALAARGGIAGYGSPHMSAAIRNNIWPMSIAVAGLTSESAGEKRRRIEELVATTGGTGWMHESFDANDPTKFTRSWFCWADALFAELVMSLSAECPRGAARGGGAGSALRGSSADDTYDILAWEDPVRVPGGAHARDP
jgi:meiotically up-regulated gene 157 (Mug157) protein